jgi:6-phosphofructokinase 1
VGAEFAIIPEKPFKFDRLVEKIQRGIERGKKGSIVIVAEGKKPGLGVSIAQRLRAKLDVEVRDLTLGHLQRGGSPSRLDRNLASRFGDFAVELIDQHQNRVMTAWQKAQLVAVRFERVAGRRKSAQLSDLRLIDRLSI